MKSRLLVLTAFVGVFCMACATDDKGASCGLLDLLVDSDGNTYCPDPTAVGDCEDLMDAFVDAAVVCGDGAFTEDELRERLTEDGLVQETCDGAVATDVKFDDCLEALEDPECEGGSFVPGDVCKGVVLNNEA